MHTACACSATHEPFLCCLLRFEGFGLLCVRPVILVTACLPSLVEGAKIVLSPAQGHPSEGWREVTPRLPLSLQAALLCSWVLTQQGEGSPRRSFL